MSLSPDERQAPDFWAVHSQTGMHIGLWPNRVDALAVFCEDAGNVITPLYRSPPSDMLAAEAKLDAVTRERDAALYLLDRNHRAMASQLAETGRRAEAAEAIATRLREALEPFGDIDGEGDEDYPDDTKVEIKFGRSTVYTVVLGDFRRGRAALNPTGALR